MLHHSRHQGGLTSAPHLFLHQAMPHFKPFSSRALASWRPEAVGATEAGREALGFMVTQQTSYSMKSRTEVRGFRPRGFANLDAF